MRAFALLLLASLLTACGSSAEKHAAPNATARPRTYAAVPRISIDIHRVYSATVHTTDGAFTMSLQPRGAPLAVNNFIFLARHGFYDGLVFHRIVKGAYVQAGDPTGTGTGGPGYHFRVEKPTRPYTVGTVAMARTAAPNSNGSQFFVIVGAQGTGLPPNYTILGQVTAGMDALRKIANTPVAVNPATGELSDPLTDVRITSVSIR